MDKQDIHRMAQQVGYPIQHKEWEKATEEFAALAYAAGTAAERNRLQSAAECFRMCEHKGVCNEKAKSNETD